MSSTLLPFEIEGLPPELIADISDVPSTHRFLVSPQDVIFVLERGNIDLFFLPFEGRQAWIGAGMQLIAERFLSFPGHYFPGSLHFLASFESGEWLFPFALNPPDLFNCVLAVARGNCTVSRLSLPKLRQALPRSPTLQTITLMHVQEWVKRLNLMDHGLVLDAFPSILNPYDRYQLDAGAVFMNFRSKEVGAQQEAAWLKVYRGSVCAWGIPALSSEGPVLYPFSSSQWFKCLQPATVELFLPILNSLLAESSWSGIVPHQKHFCDPSTIIQTNRHDKRKSKKCNCRFKVSHILLDQSLQELQTVINPQPAAISGPEQDLLFQACQQVGNYLGLEFSWPKSMVGTAEERIQALCLTSQIYFRKCGYSALGGKHRRSLLWPFSRRIIGPWPGLPSFSGYQLFILSREKSCG